MKMKRKALGITIMTVLVLVGCNNEIINSHIDKAFNYNLINPTALQVVQLVFGSAIHPILLKHMKMKPIRILNMRTCRLI